MNIFLNAYYRLNLGDDLFVKIIAERYPQVNFSIFCLEDFKTPFLPYNNVTLVSYSKNKFYLSLITKKVFGKEKFIYKERAELISKSDATIYIGGSIFMQTEGWHDVAKNLFNDISLSEHYFIIGSNFGPYHTHNYLDYHKMLFNHVDDICFRDEYSYDLFSDFNNVRIAPDVVFGLDPSSTCGYIADDKKYVVVSVIDLIGRKDLHEHVSDYEQLISELISEFNKLGFETILMSFCEQEGDEDAIERIMDSLPQDVFAKSYFYRGNIDEALSIIKCSSGIFATRFHAMILGWVYNIPTIPFLYSKKMRNVINDIDFPNLYLEIDQIKKFDVSQVIEAFFNYIPIDIQDYQVKANNQFKAVDEFVLKKVDS